MKNFIEVGKTEEEQVEQIKKWIKENGMQIVAGVLIGLSAIWGLDAYKQYQYSQSVEARTNYLNLASSPINSYMYDELKASYADSGYTDQATLIMAKYAVDNKDYAKALEHLNSLTNSENEFVANIAKIRAANINLEIGNHEQALSLLETTNNSFNGLYNHARGDVYVATNEIDLAKKHYQLALTQISKESELQSLITIKLNDLN